MRITILGSGTGVPTGERQPAGVVVSEDGHQLLLDSGSGTAASLARAGLDYRALETLLYTHAHVDHTLDLAAILHALNFTPGYQRRSALRVIGPAGFSIFVDRLLSAYPSLEQRSFPLLLEEMDGCSRENLGWARLISATVPHGNVPANAYRLETSGGAVVFSGDCSPSQALVELARGADLLLSEASFPIPVPEGEHHLTTAQAATMAQEAGVEVLVLTHFYPWAGDHDAVAECAQYFDGKVILAEDNLVIELQAGEVKALWDRVT
jgi:ribonuclease BN (tRNA processing enzyme)